MAIFRTKLTSRGQVSVPLEVRKRLGIGPGSLLEWAEEEGKVVVRKVKFSFDDIHQAISHGETPKPRTLDEMKEGIRQRVRERYAGR